MAAAVVPQCVRDEECEAALTLLFHDLPADECRGRIANALRLIKSGELDPSGIFVLRSQAKLTGVVVCVPVPGASALVWPPHVVNGPQRGENEDMLTRHAMQWLRGRGVKLAQCLLTGEEVKLAAPLERNGFNHITHLWYLRHDLQLGTVPKWADKVDFLPYGPTTADKFHQTLLRTYEDTLDCPEVSGVRTLDEILLGHKAQGVIPPNGWLLGMAAGRPIGVSLLICVPDSNSWELAYTGVVPEDRRRGYGCQLVVNALRAARAGGAEQLTLSVDGRNAPASSLYKRLGFTSVDRREVLLASWG